MFHRLIAIISLCSLVFIAQAKEIVEKDSSVPVYHGAVIFEASELSRDADWLLALSKNRKIDGSWRYDKEQLLRGDVIKVTYQVRTKNTFHDVSRFYQTFAETGDKTVLFSCKGRECGSSNEWANGHFGVEQLYGPDANQRYWAYKTATKHVVIYLVERGNGRIFLHIETFIEKPATDD